MQGMQVNAATYRACMQACMHACMKSDAYTHTACMKAVVRVHELGLHVGDGDKLIAGQQLLALLQETPSKVDSLMGRQICPLVLFETKY